jgi:CRP-like cAMP-binding protein
MDALGVLLASDELSAAARPTLQRLAERMTRRQLPRYTRLYHEGDPAGPAYLVESGSIWLTSSRPDGSTHFVADVGPGGLVGDHTALTGRDRTVTATAATESVVWSIPRQALIEAVSGDARLAMRLLEAAIELVIEKDIEAAVRAGSTTIERLAALLLELSERMTAAKDGYIPLSHAELALMAGTTRESVSRNLAILKDRGAIGTSRRGVSVLRRDLLEDLAG